MEASDSRYQDGLSSRIILSPLPAGLRSFLKDALLSKDAADKVTLAVADAKLGGLIKEKLDIKCVYDNTILELMRGIRGQLESLVSGLSSADANAMKLGLSHSLCRYKLKFSPDKVDTMIVQAIALLDELDKELVREGRHEHPSTAVFLSLFSLSPSSVPAPAEHLCHARARMVRLALP